jgi:hypothetical protein
MPNPPDHKPHGTLQSKKAAETRVHIEIAFRHHYLSQQIFEELDNDWDKILAQIAKMIDQADLWAIQPQKNPSRT